MRYIPPNGRQVFAQRGWTPAVRGLIIANVIVYFLQMLTSGRDGSPLVDALALTPQSVRESFAIWQFVTYMFLHGGLMHIAFNMLGLWMFGAEVERIIGTRRFLWLYFGSGVIGAVLHFVITIVFNRDPSIHMIGASGGVIGVVVAFAIYCGEAIVLFFLFFPMKARTAAILFVAIDLFAGVQSLKDGRGDGVAHFAHLGGALFGYLYCKGIRGAKFGRIFSSGGRKRFKPRLIKTDPPGEAAKGGDVLKNKVDQILDKIHTQGVTSLTDEERRILDEASRNL